MRGYKPFSITDILIDFVLLSISLLFFYYFGIGIAFHFNIRFIGFDALLYFITFLGVISFYFIRKFCSLKFIFIQIAIGYILLIFLFNSLFNLFPTGIYSNKEWFRIWPILLILISVILSKHFMDYLANNQYKKNS